MTTFPSDYKSTRTGRGTTWTFPITNTWTLEGFVYTETDYGPVINGPLSSTVTVTWTPWPGTNLATTTHYPEGDLKGIPDFTTSTVINTSPTPSSSQQSEQTESVPPSSASKSSESISNSTFTQSNVIGASVGTAIGALLIFVIAFILYRRRKRHCKSKSPTTESALEEADAQREPLDAFSSGLEFWGGSRRRKEAAEIPDSSPREMEDTGQPAELDGGQKAGANDSVDNILGPRGSSTSVASNEVPRAENGWNELSPPDLRSSGPKRV